MVIWNRVTWYSRYLALFFFTLVFPVWTFYLGTQYEKAKDAQNIQTVGIPIKENKTTTPTTTPNQTKVDSGIEGSVIIGPTCPVQTTPPESNCADKPYSVTLIFRNLETNKTTTAKSNLEGNFSIALEPGIYKIEDSNPGVLPRMNQVENLVVEDGKYTSVMVTFDSGIR